jgi:hypothetical protein
VTLPEEIVAAQTGGTPTAIEPVTRKKPAPANPELSHARNLADAVVFLSLAGLLGYAWFLGRGLSFFLDDWNLVVDSGNRLLIPHFGHISVVPRALYRLLLAIFGLHSYVPYRMMGCAAFALFGVSLYLYLRARVSAWPACFVAVGFIWFSQSDLFPPLFAVLVNYTIPLAATIGIWALLDRRSWKADWIASALLVLALASSGVGLMAAVAVGAEFLVARAPPRRWLRFAPPVLLWLVWYVRYHRPTGNAGSLTDVLVFTLHEFNNTVAAFAGGSQLGGWLLAVVVAACLTFAITHPRRYSAQTTEGLRRSLGHLVRPHAHSVQVRDLMPDIHAPTFTPRAAGALAAAIGFAVATAITRRTIFGAQNANVGRYLWVIGFFLAIALTECLPIARLGTLLTLLAVPLLVINGALLADNLNAQRSSRLNYQATTQPLLAATQAVGKRANPHRFLPISLVPIHAAEYLRAVSEFGAPPGTTGRSLGNAAATFNGGTASQSELKADRWMITDLDIRARPTGYLPAQCRALNPAQPKAVIPPGTLLVLQTTHDPVSVKLRRFAPTYDNPAIAVLPPQSLRSIWIPRDHSPVPWRVHLTTHSASTYRCHSAAP